MILGGEFFVMQAPMIDGFSFDPFSLFDDGFSSSEVGIGRRDVVETLVVSLMVVVLDELLDLGFQVAWQIADGTRFATTRGSGSAPAKATRSFAMFPVSTNGTDLML